MIADIRLKQFRSYIDKTVKLQDGINIIFGPNASGKTNLLEAIMMVCVGKSYRASDSELVMQGKLWSRIDSNLNDGTKRTLRINLENQSPKNFTINHKTIKRLLFNYQIPVVLFEPSHLSLVSGSPENRRVYLDSILEQINPEYKHIKTSYAKNLRQRNSLLKKGDFKKDEIFPWNIRLSQLGGSIVFLRNELTSLINSSLKTVYDSLSSGNETITTKYAPHVETAAYETNLLKKLEHDLALDILRGYTAHGPHREDMEILINGKNPSVFASRGETRTITVALKIIEAEIIKQKLNQQPILLMDDIFSELDSRRASHLSDYLKNGQSIVTTTDLNIFKNKTNANLIDITKI